MKRNAPREDRHWHTTEMHDHAGLPSSTNLLWDDVRISLAQAKQAGANTPTFGTFISTTQAHSFSNTAMQELFADIQLPHAWAYGTTVSPHLHWSPGNSTNTGVVRWGLEYSWANYGDAFGSSTTIYAEQTGGGVAYQHQIAEFPDITATGKKASSVLMLRLFRDGANGADTFTGAGGAFALSFDLHIQLDKLGGATEYAGAT